MNNIFRLSIFALLVLGIEMPNAVFGQREPAAQRIVLKRDNCRADIDNNRFIGGAVLSMYKNTWLQLTFICPENVDSFNITSVEWRLLSPRCVNMDSEQKCNMLLDTNLNSIIEYLHYSSSMKLECSKVNRTLHFPFYAGEWHIVPTAQSRRKRKEPEGASNSPSSFSLSGLSATDSRNPGGPRPPSGNPAPPAGPAPQPPAAPADANKLPSNDSPVFSPPSSPTGEPSLGAPSIAVPSNDRAPGTPTIGPNTPVGPLTSIGSAISTGNIASNKTQQALPPDGSILRTESDGFYWFIIRISTESSPSVKQLDVDIMPLAKYGHISALDWPLLRFYAVMFLVYALSMIVWLVLCCCYHKDMLHIQYWITGVIVIGLLENAVFLIEYDTMNSTGYRSVYGALVLGELLSCGRKALARLLVIIISSGIGVVKPRMGKMLYKVLVVGVVYFIACSVGGLIRINNSKTDVSNSPNIVYIFLFIIDIAICWWILRSLVLTMKTLRLRKDVVKLSLYRHFTNTLIFFVLASVGFMIGMIKEYRLPACIEDWKLLWVEQAIWHLLFSIVLLVIIILWRPSVNNQRYAYSPLQDAEEEESEAPISNTAHDGIYLISKSQENDSRLYHHAEEETT